MTNRNERMAALQANGLDTSKYFNLNFDIPLGTNVSITVNGVTYVVDGLNDAIVKDIIEQGYVFNPRVDGRWVTAQTFKMLNSRTWNPKTRNYETGWNAYLNNCYNYMYQFDMMLDEIHKLAKMERSNDPDFARLSNFFTKQVVYETCKHYIRQLRKFINNQPNRKHRGRPYVKLSKYGYVYTNELNEKVYDKLNSALLAINNSGNYSILEDSLKLFVERINKLPTDTPKCSWWKDAFKGKGAYVTLLNIIKFHNVTVQNYETGEALNRDNSIAYVESLLDTYRGDYWKFHELLKATIERNNFDLRQSIESKRTN